MRFLFLRLAGSKKEDLLLRICCLVQRLFRRIFLFFLPFKDQKQNDKAGGDQQDQSQDIRYIHDTYPPKIKGAYNRSHTHRKTQTPIVATQTETELQFTAIAISWNSRFYQVLKNSIAEKGYVYP